MPVKSMITSPQDGFSAPPGPLTMRGHGWSGHVPLAKVELSFDGGRLVARGSARPLPGRFAWRRFKFTLADPPRGDIEIAARATDTKGERAAAAMRVVESARLSQQHGAPRARPDWLRPKAITTILEFDDLGGWL